jgi:hypothetical protein
LLSCVSGRLFCEQSTGCGSEGGAKAIGLQLCDHVAQALVQLVEKLLTLVALAACFAHPQVDLARIDLLESFSQAAACAAALNGLPGEYERRGSQ